MTVDESAVATIERPEDLASIRTRRQIQIAIYFSVLLAATGLGSPGGIASLPVQFYLKNRLHFTAEDLARFASVAAIPIYVSFLFGFLRDRWKPFGLGDRGYLLLASPIAVGSYWWLSAGSLSYIPMLSAIVLATFAYMMLSSAANALMTLVAQERAMTGRLSALFNVWGAAPGIVAGSAGGWMAAHVAPQATFLLAAALSALIFVQAFFRPEAVFARAQPVRQATGTNCEALRRFAGHRPLWPAAGMLLLWNFGPGMGAPLLYYMTGTVKMSEAMFGTFTAISAACGAMTPALYGLLCRQVSLGKLLWWGTWIGVIVTPLYMLVHSPLQGLIAAAIVGWGFGFVPTGYTDLLMRTCPQELEGAGFMLMPSIIAAAGAASNLFGAWLYVRGGFALSLGINTLCTALILPIVWVLPRRLAQARDCD